jgi:hypothetical protein
MFWVVALAPELAVCSKITWDPPVRYPSPISFSAPPPPTDRVIVRSICPEVEYPLPPMIAESNVRFPNASAF